MNQPSRLQNCHLGVSRRLEFLFGLGNIDWKWTTDPGTGLSVFLKILGDSFPEIAVARFLGVVAGGNENNACKKDERESAHKKHPPDVIDRSERFPAGQSVLVDFDFESQQLREKIID